MIDWSFEVDNKVASSADDVIRNRLISLRNDLKIEMKDQKVSRSVRNYKKELMDATVMVIKHYKKSL